jgi:hypothetical protein
MRFILCILLLLSTTLAEAAVLNFSDITSGPRTGNTDGTGSGAIVTIWGQQLGSTQGTSKIYVGNVEATAIYYWKDADGTLPGGPANLSAYHKMQEIAFAIPATAPVGDTTISVVVDGSASNTIPFTVRTGNIYFIKSTGSDTTGTGSWSAPWQTLSNVVSGNGKISAGAIVYSVGVGATANVNVGYTAALSGSIGNPFSVIAYPNTTVTLTGGDRAVRNWNAANAYWNFSKFSVTTTYEAFSVFGYSRLIGNKVTGPNVGAGYSGWVGGNCTGTGSALNCSGHKVLGNEVYDYGNVAGINVFQHLMYISNRSGYLGEAYEVGWNYFHDNPVYHGIHIYDQSPNGGWSGTFKIHDNVIKNQSGYAINLMFDSNSEVKDFDVYNNIIVIDSNYNLGGLANPLDAIRLQSTTSTFKIYNNTVYGYGASAINPFQGTATVRNNLFVDTRNVAYSGNTPAVDSNNAFYSMVNANLSLPSWAAGSINGNPLFTNAGNYDFSLQENSPLRSQGYDVRSVVARDFLGYTRTSSPDIGAISYSAGAPVSETCSDGIQNQNETGIDCGGVCSACIEDPPPVVYTSGPGIIKASGRFSAR